MSIFRYLMLALAVVMSVLPVLVFAQNQDPLATEKANLQDADAYDFLKVHLIIQSDAVDDTISFGEADPLILEKIALFRGNYLIDRFAAYAAKKPAVLQGIKWQILTGPAVQELYGPATYGFSTQATFSKKSQRRVVVFSLDPQVPAAANPFREFLQKEIVDRQIQLVFDPQAIGLDHERVLYHPLASSQKAVLLVAQNLLAKMLQQKDPAQIKELLKPELIKHDLLHPTGPATQDLTFRMMAVSKEWRPVPSLEYEVLHVEWDIYPKILRIIDEALYVLGEDFARELETGLLECSPNPGNSSSDCRPLMAITTSLRLSILQNQLVWADILNLSIQEVFVNIVLALIRNPHLEYAYDPSWQKIKIGLPANGEGDSDGRDRFKIQQAYFPLGLIKIGDLSTATAQNPPARFKGVDNEEILKQFVEVNREEQDKKHEIYDQDSKTILDILETADTKFDNQSEGIMEDPAELRKVVAEMKGTLEKIKERYLRDLAASGLREDPNGRFYIDANYLRKENAQAEQQAKWELFFKKKLKLLQRLWRPLLFLFVAVPLAVYQRRKKKLAKAQGPQAPNPSTRPPSKWE